MRQWQLSSRFHFLFLLYHPLLLLASLPFWKNIQGASFFTGVAFQASPGWTWPSSIHTNEPITFWLSNQESIVQTLRRNSRCFSGNMDDLEYVATATVNGTRTQPLPKTKATVESPGLPYLMKTILRLQASDVTSVRIRPKTSNERGNFNPGLLNPSVDTIQINSLVFAIRREGQSESITADDTQSDNEQSLSSSSYVLAILRSCDRVDLQKLEDAVNSLIASDSVPALNASKKFDNKTSTTTYNDGVATPELDRIPKQRSPKISLSLAPSEQLSYLCGFESGTIPPVGLCPSPILTLLEATLLSTPNVDTTGEGIVLLEGGGGKVDQSVIVSLDTLLRSDVSSNLHILDFKIEKNGVLRTSDLEVDMETTTEESNKMGSAFDGLRMEKPFENLHVLQGHEDEIIRKPFFVVAPPETSVVEQILKRENNMGPASQSQPSEIPYPKPEWVTVVGRISGVRQMARRLVFADLAPPLVQYPSDPLEPDDHPWRNPQSGGNESMAVQLILGKTFCQRRGNDNGEAALRRLKHGQLVLVQGKTNVGNNDSLKNWVSKRSLDVVVFDFQLLLAESSLMSESSRSGVPRQMYHRNKSESLPSSAMPEEYLKLEDLFPVNDDGCNSPIQLVDSPESIKLMNVEISSWLQDHPTEFGLVGLDSEWKPNFLMDGQAEPQPVLLLQMCVLPIQRIYLIDLQSLLRPLLVPSEPMQEPTEAALSEVLKLVFQTPRLIKVGFQVLNDLQKLAASYPHIEGIDRIDSVLETSKLGLRIMQMTRQSGGRIAVSSLSKMTEYVLPGKALDKTEQVSDWSRRPLTVAQQRYAALDAAVTPVMTLRLMQSIGASITERQRLSVDIDQDDTLGTMSNAESFSPIFPDLSRWKDDTALRNMIVSVRFLFLDSEQDHVAIQRLRAKQHVETGRHQNAIYIATQTWTVGDDTPKLPFIPTDGSDVFTDLEGTVRVPSRVLHVETDDEHGQDCIGQLVGKWVAKSKHGCVMALLDGNSILNEADTVDFPQRSGYVEFSNAVALFVTLPLQSGRGRPRSYPNEWLEDGSILSWFLQGNDWKEGSSNLAKKLTEPVRVEAGTDGNRTTHVSDPLVVLFVRRGKGHFFCCGRCRVVRHPITKSMATQTQEVNWKIVRLYLLLKDWPGLHQQEDFQELVRGS